MHKSNQQLISDLVSEIPKKQRQVGRRILTEVLTELEQIEVGGTTRDQEFNDELALEMHDERVQEHTADRIRGDGF